MLGTQAQGNQGAGVRDDFGLPAMVGLVAGHGVFAALVPLSGGLAIEILFAYEGCLYLPRPLRIDTLLAMAFPGATTGVGLFSMAGRLGRRMGTCLTPAGRMRQCGKDKNSCQQNCCCRDQWKANLQGTPQ